MDQPFKGKYWKAKEQKKPENTSFYHFLRVQVNFSFQNHIKKQSCSMDFSCFKATDE